MAPVFSGALMPKKKGELQDISNALGISDQGTKDELLNRIKRHLELNPELEEDSSFAGLFPSRRKRSIQPQSSAPSPPNVPTQSAKPTSRGRRVTALEPVRESTPNNQTRDVSTFLKDPPSSPFKIATPNQSPRQAIVATPSSLPPLPPSPVKSIIERLTVPLSAPPNMEALTAKIKETEKDVMRNSMEMLDSFRGFLSNSRNVWSLTALGELLYLIHTVIPWKTLTIPLFQPKDATVPISFSLRYPPLAVFQDYVFWSIILHWALPTLIIPAIVGNLISFSPKTVGQQQQPPSPDVPYPTAPFDPLTAAIIRLAAQVGYPFALLESDVYRLDVLGPRWRVLNASVGLAFAFAEAIAGTPQVFARTLVKEQRRERRLLESPRIGESVSVRRKVLMPSGSPGEEVD
ncbi:hypothetical protein H0H81_006193 [Sphagnurus paluster]|uniref:SAP domain-containing protein n=1 Tax=Sphagnurus paluster TaxID=117069 RepID=A0A9P7FY63_9AGAR|nr:hypothetical protein H0H81_006193 [Sphagnurus paluster]